MIGYNQTEIPTKNRSWVWMLRNMQVGDTFVADLEDRQRIMVSISSNFHKNTPYRFSTKKIDEFTFVVQREKDVLDGGMRNV